MTANNTNDADESAPRLWSRRELVAAGIAGSALLGAGAIGMAAAAPAPRSRAVIDVHNHFNAPIFRAAWDQANSPADAYILERSRRWSPAWLLDQMDQAGVATSVLSQNDRALTAALSPEKRGQLSRQVNEYAAKISQEHPARIQFFANLPMPDVDGALAEIRYALDTLGAMGVHLMTSYGDLWPGDPTFRPILEELNRRQAAVFCHPRTAKCCGNLMPSISANAATLIEYPYDTGRAVLSLLLSGGLASFPDIKWIFCHVGAVIPVVAHRFNATSVVIRNLDEIAPKGIDYELRRLYWDTALANSPGMRALLDYSPVSQLMFGSDLPYFDVKDILGDVRAIGRKMSLTRAQMQAIEHGNAVRIMPRLGNSVPIAHQPA